MQTIGIISACAEQTRRGASGDNRPWDHLRVCGADTSGALGGDQFNGSSPRVRSRPVIEYPGVDDNGIISACAEQTVGRR